MKKLYLVPTPIGNLEDMTYRGIKVLKSVDFILSEDTRTSFRLLKHFEISKPLYSYHSYNEHQTLKKNINRILSSTSVALISDAGTPAISDPGFLLTRECIAHGIQVECLPGATAFVPALINSGLPNHRFVFEGFLPIKKGRRARLKELSLESRTMIFYEAPHKLMKTLADFKLVFGENRRISISKELTKIYEQNIRGSVGEVESYFLENHIKGEFVIVVSGIENE